MILIRNCTLVLYSLFATLFSYPGRIYLKLKYKDNRERYNKNYYKLKKICRNIISIIGIEVDMHGQVEEFRRNGSFMYAGNHRSNFDSIILIACIEQPIIFIGKDEIRKMPIIGSWFIDIGAIFLKREDIKASIQVINKGIECLKTGYSVVIFPEGKRIKTNKVESFKPGSFKLATKTNSEIIPFSFFNTEEIFERRSYFYPSKIGLCVAKPINLEKSNLNQTGDVASYVQRIVSDMYEYMKNSN
ncbi:1-acyl-sn-glycerol-3-phosphate acyltransferase [Pseudobutyrivibrio ruminis]|uniref:1-acyl-sn-glycerol-3-phosphate acyltransferase n=1 Tax=Pseudobutyrivibrio ruminis TaxID=46206 RepID=A0A2G3E7X3_9FIRM|nr:lysophospholipid acyltransferase family protein [Pseudobutyrivibrio ruminis]PHU39388.1 1-acyl-sn-glycerol-3-phosphate acyltransferase [Pseudobutyrivibrio ruminis]